MFDKVFHRLTVIGGPESRKGRLWWDCRCICGNTTWADQYKLLAGRTKSCGCLRRENLDRGNVLHGHLKGKIPSRTYTSWSSMITRCNNPNVDNYKYYGGRGICVCERWNVFTNFLEDMGERPIGRTLDRIDNEGNYEPGNCQWSDQSTQMKSRRLQTAKPSNTIYLTLCGKQIQLRDACKEYGISYTAVIHRRSRYKLSGTEAFLTQLDRLMDA